MDGQVERINDFAKQIEKASSESKKIVILGDANPDHNTWQDPNFLYPRVAEILIESLNQNGLTVLKLGNTYQANHALANGHVAESAIDHIYMLTL